MTGDDTAKRFIIGVAIKIFIVVAVGTALAFWMLSRL